MQCAASSSFPRNIKLSSVVKPGRLCSPRPTAARSKTSSTDKTDILLSAVSRQSGAATVTGTASGLFTRLGAPVGRAAALAASPALADSSWTYCRSTGTDTSSSADVKLCVPLYGPVPGRVPGCARLAAAAALRLRPLAKLSPCR
jgi:hypothetical protein